MPIIEERAPEQKQCMAKSLLFNGESTQRLLHTPRVTIEEDPPFPAVQRSQFQFGRSIATVKVNRNLSSTDSQRDAGSTLLARAPACWISAQAEITERACNGNDALTLHVPGLCICVSSVQVLHKCAVPPLRERHLQKDGEHKALTLADGCKTAGAAACTYY